MKRITHLTVLALILLAGCKSKTLKNPEFIALKGATIFIGNGEAIDNSVIIIKKEKIQSIGSQELGIPDNSEVIDLSGKFISPGLVDSHVHFGQTGFFNARPDVIDIRDSIDYVQLQSYLQNNPDRYYEAYLRSGVTAVYDVGGYLWSLKLQNLAENNLNAPHVAAAGPLLTYVSDENLAKLNTPGQKQLLNLSSSDFGRQTVRQNTSLGSTGIKIWQINLKDPEFMESLNAVAAEVSIQGNKLIVHATTLDQAKEALRLKAKVLVHSVEDQPIDEEFIQLAKEAKVTYCPTLIVGRGYYNAFKALRSDFTLVDINEAVDAETKDLLRSANKFYKYLPNPERY
jgi:imidazolonepropionase-like amidohydrolase